MKRSLIITTLLFFLFTLTSQAQRWRDKTDVSFGHSYHHAHKNYGDRHFSYDYTGGSRHYTLSRQDKKKLARLQNDLDRTRNRALRDGFVSDRENRKIRQIKADIARLLDRNSHWHSGRRNVQSRRSVCR